MTAPAKKKKKTVKREKVVIKKRRFSTQSLYVIIIIIIKVERERPALLGKDLCAEQQINIIVAVRRAYMDVHHIFILVNRDEIQATRQAKTKNREENEEGEA